MSNYLRHVIDRYAKYHDMWIECGDWELLSAHYNEIRRHTEEVTDAQ